MYLKGINVAVQYFLKSVCLLACVAAGSALAQQSAQPWPAPGKSIKVVVPFPAGSGTTLGAQSVARAQADGN